LKDLVLGIDIGGTNTKFGFVDREGNVHGESSSPTRGYPMIDDYLSQLHKQIDAAKAFIGLESRIVGVGIGAPNGNFYTGMIEQAPNLEWKGRVHFVDKIRKYFPNQPVILTNDANAAAVGEMTFGSAVGMKNFIVFTLGTGLGSGIVANGQVIYGHDGFAGELGHVIVNPRGRVCGCGRRGCLETYVSATGIQRTVYKLIADHTEQSSLRSVAFDNLTAKMITDAALEGDFIAKEAFEYTGKVLGQKIADTVAHFSPEAIFLFGGLVNAGEHLLKPTRFHMEDYMMSIYKGKVKLLVSGLQHKNAAVLGAASLAWRELDMV
jgi:glucokinase